MTGPDSLGQERFLTSVASACRLVRILVIGTFPPPTGESTVLLKLLLDDLARRHDVEVTAINTGGSGNNVFSMLWRLLRSISQSLQRIRSTDVVTLHLNRPTSAFIFLLLSRFFRKPVILRFFGGADYRTTGGATNRRSLEWAIRQADLTLFETKRLVAMAKEDGARRVEWYSNSRHMPPAIDTTIPRRTQCKHFVFLGHVNAYKGVREIIAIDNSIPNDAHIDLYGPLQNGFRREAFLGLQRVTYCGEISPEKVMVTLSGYDALLLPTYYSGEGYPGVILEAFAVGIPIITTAWLSIPEIADDSCAILIPPKSRQALAEAIERLYFDKALYTRLCAGSAAKRAAFSAQHWTDVFVEHCRGLLAQKKGAD